MKVCFTCITNYHIFVSYVLCKTLYKDDYKIIILNDFIENSKEVFERIKRSGIWNECYFIEEKELLYENNRKKYNNVINDVISKLGMDEWDRIHLFTWGHNYGSKITNCINKRTKLILTEEGLGSYIITGNYVKPNVIKRISNFYFKDSFKFNKIYNILLFNSKLFCGDKKYENILYNAEILKYFSDEKFFCQSLKDLELLFENNISLKHKIIFFDANLGYFFNENLFLKELNNYTDEFDILLKKHPLEFNENKFNKLNFQIMEDNRVPWEVIYMKNNESRIYLSYYSTAMFNNKVIFGGNDKFILLYKLVEKYFKKIKHSREWNNTINGFEQYLNKYIKFYGEEDIFIPTSFEELQDILKNLTSI